MVESTAVAISWGDLLASLLISEATSAIKGSSASSHLWLKFLANALGKPREIFIYGPSSVGKTFLFNTLLGKQPDVFTELIERSEDTESHINNGILFNVLPGQGVKPVRKIGSANGLRGVVYVCANGMFAPRPDYPEYMHASSKFKSFHGPSGLQESNLTVEVNKFRQLCDEVSRRLETDKSSKCWILITLTCIDLLSDEDMNSCESRYDPFNHGGEFGKIVLPLFQKFGENRLRLGSSFVCSWIDDFFWNGNKVPSRRFTDPQRRNILSRYYKSLINLDKSLYGTST